MTQVEIDGERLTLGSVTVSFQRTLRIPETGLHPLPPGLGRFPLRRVADYPDTAPADWLARGGIMLPIYQREARWLSFAADEPAAIPAPPSSRLEQQFADGGGLGEANSPAENQLIAELDAPTHGLAPAEYPSWSSLLVGPTLRHTKVTLK